MTMKKMKNFMALLLALVMTMSLVACGNKTSEETKTGEEIGCYVQTTETGEKVLVDKDGKAVTDFTLDADGNVLDADGNVVVKAEDITAYVEQSGNVTDEKAEEPKVDDAQKTEDTLLPNRSCSCRVANRWKDCQHPSSKCHRQRTDRS